MVYPSFVIKGEGHQWYWSYQYSNLGQDTQYFSESDNSDNNDNETNKNNNSNNNTKNENNGYRNEGYGCFHENQHPIPNPAYMGGPSAFKCYACGKKVADTACYNCYLDYHQSCINEYSVEDTPSDQGNLEVEDQKGCAGKKRSLEQDENTKAGPSKKRSLEQDENTKAGPSGKRRHMDPAPDSDLDLNESEEIRRPDIRPYDSGEESDSSSKNKGPDSPPGKGKGKA